MRQPPYKIKEKKMGREGNLGLCDHSTKTVFIDPRQRDDTRLDTAIHEALHVCDDALSETEVRRQASIIARFVWADGYRRANV